LTNNNGYTLFCDCGAGVSGDMFLAALADLGLSQHVLFDTLKTLPIGHFELFFEDVSVSGINAKRFKVEWDERKQVNRNIKDILDIIKNSGISLLAKERSEAVFRKLAEAEAKVHGTTVEKIHFHEVGAIDSIIDIVGAVVGMEFLGVDYLVFPQLKLGSGYIDCQHGRIPIPAPATLELLKGLDLLLGTGEGEKVTPTGAALLSALGRQVSGDFPISPHKIGCGAGMRKTENPNILRLIYGNSLEKEEICQTILLESDIDDMNPQWLGRLMEVLFAAGALDVVFIPIQMKKNRPATRINVLCEEIKKPIMLDILFKESTTLGIRYQKISRHCLERKMSSVKTPWGMVRVKNGYWKNTLVQQQPEYEDMREIVEKTDVSLKELYKTVISSLKSK